MAATGSLSPREREVTDNPLLAVWQEVYGRDASYCWLDRPVGVDVESYRRRTAACAAWSFAVPSDEALDLIASYGPIVEIGAGTGYWASLLRIRGCDVIAYDRFGEDFHKWFPGGHYGDVRRGDVDQASEHADRTLLLVWPPMSSMALDALTAYETAGGRRLVYVGEGHGGCTADVEFFARLGQEYYDEDGNEHVDPSSWRQVAELPIPQWDGIHDWLTVYERQP
jgi:hypothetical protein